MPLAGRLRLWCVDLDGVHGFSSPGSSAEVGGASGGALRRGRAAALAFASASWLDETFLHRGQPSHGEAGHPRLTTQPYLMTASSGATVGRDAERPIVLLLHGPNLNLLGDASRGLRHGHAGRPRRHRQRPARPRRRGVQSNHEGELVDAIHGRARARRSSSTPAPSPTTPGACTTPCRLRRAGRRAAPVQPQRPRAVAPHQRDRPVAAGSIVGFGGFGYELATRRRPSGAAADPAPAADRLPPPGHAVRAVLDGDAGRLDAVEHPLADVVRRLARLGRHRPGPLRLSSPTAATPTGPPPTSPPPASTPRSSSADPCADPRARRRCAPARSGARRGRAPHPCRGLDLPTDLDLEPDRRITGLRRVKDEGELARMPSRAIADARSPRSPRCSPTGRPRPTSATSSSTACAASAPTGRATTRSSPAGRTTPPGRTTRPAGARSSRATR